MGGQPFVHLHVHSPYSFLDGASRIERLVEEAAALGMPAIALTDHDSVAGAVRWHQRATAAGLKPIQGVELTLEGGWHLTLLATGPQGYANLCRLVTAAHLGYVPGEWAPEEGAADAGGGPPVPPSPGLPAAAGTPGRPAGWAARRLAPRCPLAALEQYAGGLIALSGCRRGEVPARILQGDYAGAEAAARRYLRIFGRGNFYLELQATCLPGDAALHRALAHLGEHLGIPLVATANVHYRSRDEFPIHDLLTCVRTLTTLDQPHPERRINAENYLKPADAVAAALVAYPAAVAATAAIAERCQPALVLGRRLHPAFPVPPGYTAMGLLRELCYRGARERYGRLSRAVQDRLEHELGIIEKLGFADYFLLVWDVCRFARSQGIRCAGRGSAADSAVAYCLRITDVDAIARGLLFERFLSSERAEVPDIDVDFDARHRDRVAAYVYEKYGHHRVAAVCTYNTFRARSAVRDLGKAMGFPPEVVDALARRLPYFAGAADIAALAGRLPELKAAGLPWDKLEVLVRAAAAVAGLPRHLGTHLGGLVIAPGPLVDLTPLQWAAKGCAVCQFDKQYVEDLGLVKLDLLSLRTLAAVDDALRDINRERVVLDYDRLRPDDPATYELIQSGETVGIFQLESPAQRALQARLQADRFEDLVASVALIRPGPIKGNMVEPYLARRHGLQPVTYLHPALEPILKKTYGVVLFQEQVIAIATAIAGFSPGEADQLRRVMTHARNEEEMEAIGRRFVAKAVARGVDPQVAETIYGYIKGYASYGFCEAHAAAFAHTAYGTAFLLRHFPAPYLAALLSHQPMGYWPPSTLVGEARRRGVAVLPPDVNKSQVRWTPEELPDGRPAIRCGLMQVAHLSHRRAADLVAEREAGGPYRSLADLLRRVPLARDEAEALVLAGALDGLCSSRREALWRLPHLQRAPGLPVEDPPAPVVPDFDPWERLVREYQVLGVTLGDHPMAHARARLAAAGYLTAAQVKALPQGSHARCAGLVIRPHRPPTRSGRTVVFFTLEDETGLLDVTVFEDVYLRYGHLIFQDPRPPLAVWGRVDRRGRGASLVALRLQELP